MEYVNKIAPSTEKRSSKLMHKQSYITLVQIVNKTNSGMVQLTWVRAMGKPWKVEKDQNNPLIDLNLTFTCCDKGVDSFRPCLSG